MSDRLLNTASQLKVILCATEADADAIRRSGFRSVRVVNAAASIYVQSADGHVVDPALEMFTAFVLAFPAEQADLRDALAVRLGDVRCRWVEFEGGGGPARLFERHGPGALSEALRNARPMWTDEICLMSDVADHQEQRAYTTGFSKLDEHGFRLVRPAFMPVIGPYGSGKSVLVRQLCCNLLRMYGWRSLVTSFEEKIKPRYQRDLRRHLIGSEELTNDGELAWRPTPPVQWTPDMVAKADAQIESGFRFLRRKRNAVLDAERLRDRIEYAVRVYGVDVVVIDPVNEIDHVIPKGENKTDYMGRFIMGLKQLADDYDLLMIVCAHPPKEGVEKRAAKGRLMTLNDGADTAHYGNKADIGWCVWRPGLEDGSPTYLHVDKLKDHEVMGKPTLAKLVLDAGLGRFAVTRIGYDEVSAELIGEG